MDSLQIQAIEQALNYIQNQGPDAIEHLTTILQAINQGIGSLGAISLFILQWPALTGVADQLLILINAGVSMTEIATILASFATTIGVPVELIIQFLHLLGGFLLLF